MLQLLVIPGLFQASLPAESGALGIPSAHMCLAQLPDCFPAEMSGGDLGSSRIHVIHRFPKVHVPPESREPSSSPSLNSLHTPALRSLPDGLLRLGIGQGNVPNDLEIEATEVVVVVGCLTDVSHDITTWSVLTSVTS